MAVTLFSDVNFQGQSQRIEAVGSWNRTPTLIRASSLQVDPGWRITLYNQASVPLQYTGNVATVASAWTMFRAFKIENAAPNIDQSLPAGYTYTQAYRNQPPAGVDGLGRPYYEAGVRLYDRGSRKQKSTQQSGLFGGGNALMDMLILRAFMK